MTEPEIEYDLLGGNCPVQAEGRINGRSFYFRARGNRWGVEIAPPGQEAGLCSPEWLMVRAYGDQPHAAGWMSEEEAREFVLTAARAWVNGEPGSEPELAPQTA